MPYYNYHCFDCENIAVTEHVDILRSEDNESRLPSKILNCELYEEMILFETSHSVNPTAKEFYKATECPRCHGHNCEKTLYGSNITSYTRGYGWLDRKGAKRDMNRCKLSEDDPYAQYRVPGEVEHIDNQLKKEGQHDSKTKRFLIDNNEMEKAVVKATKS